GQDVVDRAEVDVPGDRALLGPLEVHLGDAVVLEDGDALLADVDRDEELALRRRKRRAARRHATARGRPRASGLLALGPLLLLRLLGARLSALGGRLGLGLRLLLCCGPPGGGAHRAALG